jgi:hypothetical protein
MDVFDVRQVARGFLGEEFGYRPVVRDAVDLLTMPQRIAKRINYLLERQGKASTFRSSKSFVEPVSDTLEFTMPVYSPESKRRDSTSSHREIDLRVAVNAIVEFPKLQVPELREDLYSQLIGSELTPTDIYDLIPWTWLIDWFGGMGDYVEALTSINRDTSLVNYGFITCKNTRYLQTDLLVRTTSTVSRYEWTTQLFKNTSYNYSSYSAALRHTSYSRKNLANVMSLKSADHPENLNAWQAAILAALVAAK